MDTNKECLECVSESLGLIFYQDFCHFLWKSTVGRGPSWGKNVKGGKRLKYMYILGASRSLNVFLPSWSFSRLLGKAYLKSCVLVIFESDECAFFIFLLCLLIVCFLSFLPIFIQSLVMLMCFRWRATSTETMVLMENVVIVDYDDFQKIRFVSKLKLNMPE